MSQKQRCDYSKGCGSYPYACDKCAIVKYVKDEVKITSAKEKTMLSDEVTVKVGNQMYRARQVERSQSCGEYPELDLSLYLAPYNKIQPPPNFPSKM